MKFVSKAVNSVSKALIATSERSAIKSANTACAAWQYQPKMPKALKKVCKK